MSIQSVDKTRTCPQVRRTAAHAQTAEVSFQDRLTQTAAGTSGAPRPQPPSHSPRAEESAGLSGGREAGYTADGLLPTLTGARLLLLQRTKEGREWKKEQEAWERLLNCLDKWIEALREKAEREDRSGGAREEGGDALLALYRGLAVGAVQAEAADTEDLLSALTEAQSTLLERLKEDKAAEEERREWEDLMKRLDRWIENLRGESGEPEEDFRAPAVSAVGREMDYNS